MCTDRVYAGTRGGEQNGSPQYKDSTLVKMCHCRNIVLHKKKFNLAGNFTKEELALENLLTFCRK